MTPTDEEHRSLGRNARHGNDAAGEKQIENWLRAKLEEGGERKSALAELSLSRKGVPETHLGALLNTHTYAVIQDSSVWNTHPGLMVDIIGGMTPDLVIRSETSGENRIFIEVKQRARLGHDKNACQLTRYFLHLLATSKQSRGEDIPRAVILAAPRAWFDVPANADAWERFVTRLGPLANHFGVMLAILYTPPQFD